MSDEQKNHQPEDLSMAEKILRVQDLWDEIARSPGEVPLTEAQRREAERRLIEHERNPKECATWEEVKRRLESER
jgi:putative addiction module component (TIGR02574 family)